MLLEPPLLTASASSALSSRCYLEEKTGMRRAVASRQPVGRNEPHRGGSATVETSNDEHRRSLAPPTTCVRSIAKNKPKTALCPASQLALLISMADNTCQTHVSSRPQELPACELVSLYGKA
eukprot:1160304-Pelagomonas_calceolata.AAC.2